MFQEADIPGAIPGLVGEISSVVVKLIVMVCMIILTSSLIKKHLERKTLITRNISLMFTVYLLAPLFSSFDILLGLKDYFGENTYVGMGLAFFFNGLGNIIYYWFTLHVYYENKYSKPRRIILLFIIAVIELFSTGMSLFLRIANNPNAFIFTVIHMVVTLYIFALILINSVRTAERVKEKEFHERFENIKRAALFALCMMIFFVIDSISDYVTIYSLIGWSLLIISSYFLYKGYV